MTPAADSRTAPSRPPAGRLAEVAVLFLKLGLTSFGGPAAHIALMHDEVVKRRKWLDDQRFLDLVGATNLIPGPNSTEMASHLGFLRAGWPGLILGGGCFALPAVVIVTVIAALYARFGAAPQAVWLLYGIKPVVIAVVAQALLSLGRRAVKGPLTAAVGLLVVAAHFLGVDEIALLFAGGLLVMALQNFRRLAKPGRAGILPPLAGPAASLLRLGPAARSLPALAAAPFGLPLLFLTFLKIGAVLYGGGYVLLAFLRADFVIRLGWLTDAQLLEAIAIGQLTPGPLFTAATFIGFTLGGLPGAALATAGIFLPSFFFVALSYPLIGRLRSSHWAGSLLDGVNAASLGLMAAVTWQLGAASLTDALTALVALASFVLLLRFRLNSTWLIAGGAVVGLLRLLVH